MNRAFLILAIFIVSIFRAAPTTAPSTRPVKILPQHQQALLFFSCYQIAADQMSQERAISDELHQKLLDRIAQGQRDADAVLAAAKLPQKIDDAIPASAKLTEQVNACTRGTVRDIH